jgi:signal transduction histidine kinase
MTFSSSPAVFPSARKPLLSFNSYDSAMDQQVINLAASPYQGRRSAPGRRSVALAREVRNPLTCINLSVDMLSASVTDPELKVYIEMIAKSSKRANQLIKELLECQEVSANSHTQY